MGRQLVAGSTLVLLCVGVMQGAEPSRLSTRFLFVQANATAPPPVAIGEDESLQASIQWRRLTMLDEHGQIPPNARYQANLLRRSHLTGSSSNGSRISPQGSISPTTWVSRGPQNVGGRTRSLLIDPTNTNVLYAGAASGGVWKSTDGGTTWAPLSDFIANINIQTMVMDPLDHNTIYAGTGESTYSDGLPG